MKRQEEYRFQVSCVEWFRLQYPKCIIYHIPNGEARNIITGARLKRMGVLAGVPDLFIAMACRGYHGLYVELKAKGGKMSQPQKELFDKFTNEGYLCKECRTFEEFQSLINWYLEKLR